jgi:hypothetical protein
MDEEVAVHGRADHRYPPRAEAGTATAEILRGPVSSAASTSGRPSSAVSTSSRRGRAARPPERSWQQTVDSSAIGGWTYCSREGPPVGCVQGQQFSDPPTVDDCVQECSAARCRHLALRPPGRRELDDSSTVATCRPRSSATTGWSSTRTQSQVGGRDRCWLALRLASNSRTASSRASTAGSTTSS